MVAPRQEFTRLAKTTSPLDRPQRPLKLEATAKNLNRRRHRHRHRRRRHRRHRHHCLWTEHQLALENHLEQGHTPAYQRRLRLRPPLHH